MPAPVGYVEDTPQSAGGVPPSGYVEDSPKDVMITPQEKPSIISDTLKYSPVGAVQGLASLLRTAMSGHNPLAGVGDANAELFNKAKDSFDKGQYADAAGHFINYLIPGGSAFEDIQDDLRNKDYGRAAAKFAGLASSVPAPKVAAAVLNKATTPGVLSGLNAADSAKDAINLYGITDPRAPERLPTGVSDIAHDSGAPITSNEHISVTSPDYRAQPAFAHNRGVWQQWMDQTRGKAIPPDSIMRSAEDSLKGFADPAVKTQILHDLQSKLTEQPLTGPRLEEINSEINNELKSGGFYSRDEAARASARAAGAQSGRSQAFLEAVGNQARNELYNMADPDNAGAGPREVQRRYGNMKMITDPATEDRAKIFAETAGSPLDKAQELATGLLNIPGRAATGQLSGPLSGIRAIFRGESDPVVKRIFDNAPEYKPLPAPNTQKLIQSPPDTSGPIPPEVRDMRSSTEGYLDPSRLLPAASSQIGVNGVIAPDLAGEIQRGINRLQSGPRQLNPARSPAGQGTIVPDVLGRAMQGMPDLLESNPGAGNTTVTHGTSEFQVPPSRYSNLRNQGTREVPAKTGIPSGTQGLQRSTDLSEGQVQAIRDAIKDHKTLTKADLARIAGMQ